MKKCLVYVICLHGKDNEKHNASSVICSNGKSVSVIGKKQYYTLDEAMAAIIANSISLLKIPCNIKILCPCEEFCRQLSTLLLNKQTSSCDLIESILYIIQKSKEHDISTYYIPE